jgi:hypothetical protein
MIQTTLFDDFETPEDARDLGLALVMEKAADWFEAACAHVANLRDWVGTGEDLRLRLVPVIGAPHTPKAWGALVHHAIRARWLERTGERRPMRTRRSHARSTDVYRSL